MCGKKIMVNILLFILSTIPTIFLMSITGNLFEINYMTILMVCFCFFCAFNGNEEHKEVQRSKAHWLKVYCAYSIDIVLYFVVLNVFKFIQEILSYKASLTLYLSLIMLLNNQVFFRSIGFRIFNLRINNDTFLNKIKIITINYIIFSVDFFITLIILFPSYESSLKPGCEFLILIEIINIWTRIRFFKTQSLLEKILKIQIFHEQDIRKDSSDTGILLR